MSAREESGREGSCLCGAVHFEGRGALGQVTPCHCGQCRRWASGPFWAVRFAAGVRVTQVGSLSWFASSDHGERGFCGRCGSVLFWRKPGAASGWGVSAGALEGEEGLGIGAHTWVEDKPGWYEFADDAPRLTAAEVLARAGGGGA